MRTPRLRETVTVQNPGQVAVTDYGAPESDGYEDAGTIKAEVEEDAGNRDRRAGRDEPTQRVTFKTRYTDLVSTESRLLWRSDTYYIAGIKAMGKERRWMQIEAYLDPDG